jgi:uncharacterized protein YoxC
MDKKKLLKKIRKIISSDISTINTKFENLENRVDKLEERSEVEKNSEEHTEKIDVWNSVSQKDNEQLHSFYLRVAEKFKENGLYLNSILLLNIAVRRFYIQYVESCNIPEVNEVIEERDTVIEDIFLQLSNSKFHTLYLNKKGEDITQRIRYKLDSHIKNIEDIGNFTQDLKSALRLFSLGKEEKNILDSLFEKFYEILNREIYFSINKENEKPLEIEIGDEPVNFKMTQNFLEQLGKECRIPNITELKNLKESGKIKKGRYWSSSKVAEDESKFFVLKRGGDIHVSDINSPSIPIFLKNREEEKDIEAEKEKQKLKNLESGKELNFSKLVQNFGNR